MKIPLYQIDAFSGEIFAGNPAAVCPLKDWLEDSIMQAIAGENNLSETAFFVPNDKGYRIRWFTPATEVDLCGHATLAAAFVLFHCLNEPGNKVDFFSRSGKLTVKREEDLLIMDFPARSLELCTPPKELIEGLGKEPLEVSRSEDYFSVFSCEEEILNLQPDMQKLKELDLRGVIATARGNKADFVSRFFAPKLGIDEDPATGSIHCSLTPYWSAKLKKEKLHAQQLSKRGGELFCENRGERVVISGRAVKFMEGYITI